MGTLAMPDLLDKTAHARIIQNITDVCETAGVQKRYLHRSMVEDCGAIEVDWVRNFRKHETEGIPGLLMIGTKNPDSRMQAIAGALLRNYIDARVIPMNSLIEDAGKGGMREEGMAAHVLLIPNLYVAASGKAVPSYKVQIIYDLLLQRSVQGKSSVVYVESMSGAVQNYGAPFGDFLGGFKAVN